MKRLYYLGVVCVLFSAACKKSSVNITDSGCISEIAPRYIKGPDSLAAVKLLNQNNIASTNLWFDRVILDDTLIINGKSGIYQHIFAIQRLNGLPVLGGQLSYFFINNIIQTVWGTQYSSANSNTTRNLTLQQVRKSYLDAAANGPLKASIKDSCLVAEFGYFDVNAGVNNAAPNLVKAWYVTPKHVNYPVALIRDDNSIVIQYLDGVYPFNSN